MMEEQNIQNNPPVQQQADMESQASQGRNYGQSYGKKPLWQWLLISLVAGGILMGLIYYFFNLKKYNSGLNGINNNQEQVAVIAVSIANSAFTPGTLSVKKGVSVIWINNDSLVHKIASDDKNGPQSPELNKGDSWTLPLLDKGEFAYHCSLHPEIKGTIQITE